MGFAAGFQTGAQAVERGIKLREDEQLKQQLADVYKAPSSGLTYTSDQMDQMRQAQASGAYDISSVPGAEGQAPTLRYTPKAGLEAGDAASARAMEFAPQQVQIYGGRSVAGEFNPDVLQGLQARRAAQVVGASGDYRGAAQLQAEALRMEREAKMAPLQHKALEQNVALGGVQLTAAQRAEQLATANQNAQNALAAMRSRNERIDTQTLSQLAKEHGADFATLRNDELNQLGFNEKTAAVEMKNLSRDWSKAALGGVPGMNKFLAEKFDPDKSDNYTPEVIQTKAGYVVKYGDRILSEYGTHKDINTLVAQVHGKINDDPLGTLKTLASVEASNASAALHRAEASLVPAKAGLLAEQSGYYKNIKGQNPTMLVNDKGEPSPVIMSALPVVNGVVQLPQGLRFPKDAQQATQLEQRAYESLAKTDAWQRAERKGDMAELNRLMVGRGLDPAKHGGAPAAADWQVATKPNATSPAPVAAPASAQPVGIQYSNDEDYRQLPYRNVNQGYSTPDARSLLRTPVYGSGMQGLKVTD